MIILGLDQAPRGIGFAFGEPGSVPRVGLHELPNYGDNTARLGEAVYEWLKEFAPLCGAARIYFEQIISRRKGFDYQVFYKQATVGCNIEIAAAHLGLRDHVFEVNIADWRREFYAGARPPKGCDELSAVWKEMAMKECARRGWWTDNHNIAEACGIWDFGCKSSDKVYKHRAKIGTRRQQSALDEQRRQAC